MAGVSAETSDLAGSGSGSGDFTSSLTVTFFGAARRLAVFGFESSAFALGTFFEAVFFVEAFVFEASEGSLFSETVFSTASLVELGFRAGALRVRFAFALGLSGAVSASSTCLTEARLVAAFVDFLVSELASSSFFRLGAFRVRLEAVVFFTSVVSSAFSSSDDAFFAGAFLRRLGVSFSSLASVDAFAFRAGALRRVPLTAALVFFGSVFKSTPLSSEASGFSSSVSDSFDFFVGALRLRDDLAFGSSSLDVS